MDIANVCLGRIAVTSIEPVINEAASPTGEASPATGATAATGPTRVDRVRRRMGWLVALIVLALLVWFALAASIAVRTRPVSASSATRFVPADGLGYQARLAFRGGEGPAGVEHTLLAGLPVTFAMSTTALLALDEPAEGLRKASWWREGVLSGDPTVPSRYRLRSIGPEGVFLRVQDWDTLGLSFEHFLELPADVGVGRRWSSSGRALGQPPDSPLRYRNNSLASTPAEADQAAAGCLEVSSATELSSPAGSEEWRETNLWCPGRGVVSSTGRLRGVAYAITETDRNPPLSTEELQARPFPTTGLDHWVTRRPEIIGGDATFGTEEPYLDSSGPVRATGNQMVVFPFASTSDLMGLIPLTSGQLWAHWWARPGGSVVATTTIGSVVVASTTQRRLVASTAGGRRRWSLRLDDVAAAPPQPIGDRALAVATVGGRLHRVDATNGRVVWSRRLPAGVRAGVAANRDLIVTADTSPAVRTAEFEVQRVQGPRRSVCRKSLLASTTTRRSSGRWLICCEATTSSLSTGG